MSDFRQMLEDSLTAPLRPGSIFGALAQKSAPSYPVMTANLAVFTSAAVAISFAHAAITHPIILHAGPPALALGILGSLLLFILLSFLGGVVLHAFSRICGGSGDFTRSYQIVSLSSSIACIAALLNWFPEAWPVPILLGAYITSVGLQILHQASKTRTWAVVALMTGLSLGGQWIIRGELQRQAGALALMENAQEDLAKIQSAAAPQKIDLENMSLQAPETPAKLVSGMDMIQSSQMTAEEAPSPEAAPAEAPSADPAAMMSLITPMLNNPALLKSMPPEDAAKMKELMEVINKTQASLKSGKPIPEKEAKAMTQKLQQLTMEMMQTMSAPNTKLKLKPRKTQP